MANSNARKKLIRLVQKYLAGKTSQEEEEFLEAYYNCFDKEVGEKESMKDDEKEVLAREMKAAIWQQIEVAQQQIPVVPLLKRSWFRMAVAAVTIAAVAIPIYYFIAHNPSRKAIVKAVHRVAPAHDALPGGNKAMLTLNDGSVIVLDSAKNGMLREQGNAQILKKEGMLEYNEASGSKQSAINNNKQQANVAYNTLSTPRGGQYQLILPDGSQVWLNAASSIRFPTAFTGNERQVELTGEAYFEITSIKLQSGEKMPFKVLVTSAAGDGRNAAVEVLGTHFNVNAYKDEETIKTTLLEGKVKVTMTGVDKEAMLNPGEQAIIASSGNDHIGTIKTVHDIDTEEAVAWKNGLFYFDNVDIQTIMRQLSRWYKVQVVYNGKVSNRRFTGQVSRNANLSQVLKILELSKIHFTIEGETVTISN